jgi:hypothetical protein
MTGPRACEGPRRDGSHGSAGARSLLLIGDRQLDGAGDREARPGPVRGMLDGVGADYPVVDETQGPGGNQRVVSVAPPE